MSLPHIGLFSLAYSVSSVCNNSNWHNGQLLLLEQSASPPSVTSRSRGSHKKARKKKTKSSENKSPVQVETAEEQQQQQTDSPNESLEITAESPAPEPPPPPPPTFKVQVNVYALEVVNVHIQYGFGIFHTGVEVHRNEWAYGGHQYDLPGIFRMKQPRNLKSLSDIDGVFTFLKTLPMGTTGRTLPEVVEVVSDHHSFVRVLPNVLTFP